MERKRIEIEAKFPLYNKKETLSKLKKISKTIEENNYQKDIYYTPAHKNFLEKTPISEWFRIRDTKKEKTINYKNWSNANKNNKISCKEIEIGIDDYNGMIEILKALDFNQIIVVEKTRNSFEYNNIIISIDSIENLDDFIELEFKTNLYDNEDESMKYIIDTLKELNIKVGEQIFAGYPQLIMKKNGLLRN